MLKKIGLVLLISLIQILFFWLVLFLTNNYLTKNKLDIAWGITIYFSFIFFSASISLINLFFLFIEYNILKITLCIIILLIVNYLPISSFEYRPYRSFMLILLINSNILISYLLSKKYLNPTK